VVTTRAARTREVDANVTTAKRSLTRMAGYMEPAKGQTTPDATGAIQLDGQTLDVVIYNILKGPPQERMVKELGCDNSDN